MLNNNQKLGAYGESLAEQYLEQKGYKILEKNFRSKFGEIDLIARHLNVLVFIEVKTRVNRSYGLPEEAIHKKKQLSLLKTSKYYLLKNNLKDVICRIDAVACEFMDDDLTRFTLRHFENIINDNH